MSPRLAEVTSQAQLLAAAGDLAGAHRLLGPVLATVDPDPARATEPLAAAAGLQARVLVALGEPQGARSWATFAHAACRRLHGDGDERTVVATATLAATLHRLGNEARATALYHDVVGQLTALDGPDSARVLAAQADLATVEHARGDCAAARARLAEACRRQQAAFGTGDLAGIKMLARLGAMERDCGNFAEAHRQFQRARQLCAAQFGPDHPMVGQIAALSRAPADRVHICRPTGSIPARPDAGRAHHPGADPATARESAVPREPATAGNPAAARRTDPAGGGSTGADAAHGAGPGASRGTGADATHGANHGAGPGQVGGARPAGGPGPAAPAVHDDDDLAAYGWQAEPPVAPPRRPGSHDDAADDLEPWWPPEPPTTTGGTPATIGRPAVPHARGPAAADQDGAAPPAADRPRTGDGTHPHRDRAQPGAGAATAGDRTAGAVALRRTGQLPVPLHRPADTDRNQRFGLLVAAGAAVVALGTAAVALGVATWGGDDPAPGPAPTAAAAAPAVSAPTGGRPSAGPSGTVPSTAPPPTGVTVRDQGDSVTLAWRYPGRAEAPVLIAGARSGQPLQAFQELPAGSDTYVVYGLNERANYCFRISVVYAATSVASAEPVCTNRRIR